MDPRPALEVDGVAVGREARPASVDELAETMRQAHADSKTMIPVGGGTRLDLGNPPRSADLGLHTTGIRGVIEYEPDNMTVSVAAGTTLDDLQHALAAGRQFLPIDPPHPARSTLGGIVSANASGPLRFRYGTMRDLLIGVRICHVDGTMSRAGGKLVKNVTGYDMCKLYTGALGTLGVLTELTFKVQPLPESVATAIVAYPALAPALEATQRLLGASLLADAFEVWNAEACRGLPLAEIPAAGWLLLVRFGEVEPAVRWQIERTRDLLGAEGRLTGVLDTDASEGFWRAAASARAAALPPGSEELGVKCSVLYASVSGTAALLEDLGGRLGASTALFCHAGNSVLYARYRWDGPASGAAALRAGLDEVRRHTAASGGHTVVEIVRPEVKNGWDAWGFRAPALEVMRRIKHEFDPKGLLNPGRFVGGI
jgi:glycolate oxidase FAD binding subunit